MKYTAPDYEIIKLNVTDLFASYPSGCQELEGGYGSYTVPCEGTPDYVAGATYSQIPGKECYTGNMA